MGETRESEGYEMGETREVGRKRCERRRGSRERRFSRRPAK
jgi:hypothetical protein